jgi:hypothetical protein
MESLLQELLRPRRKERAWALRYKPPSNPIHACSLSSALFCANPALRPLGKAYLFLRDVDGAAQARRLP